MVGHSHASTGTGSGDVTAAQLQAAIAAIPGVKPEFSVNTVADLAAIDPAGRIHRDTVEVLTGPEAGIYRPDAVSDSWVKIDTAVNPNEHYTNASTNAPTPITDGATWLTSDTADLFISAGGVWVDV